MKKVITTIVAIIMMAIATTTASATGYKSLDDYIQRSIEAGTPAEYADPTRELDVEEAVFYGTYHVPNNVPVLNATGCGDIAYGYILGTGAYAGNACTTSGVGEVWAVDLTFAEDGEDVVILCNGLSPKAVYSATLVDGSFDHEGYALASWAELSNEWMFDEDIHHCMDLWGQLVIGADRQTIWVLK